MEPLLITRNFESTLPLRVVDPPSIPSIHRQVDESSLSLREDTLLDDKSSHLHSFEFEYGEAPLSATTIIADSGATFSAMSRRPECFSSDIFYQSTVNLQFPDGSNVSTTTMAETKAIGTLLVAPKLSENVLSMSQMADNNHMTIITATHLYLLKPSSTLKVKYIIDDDDIQQTFYRSPDGLYRADLNQFFESFSKMDLN